MDSAFAQAMHASRSAVNSELQWHTPGSMAFGRDMFLDIPMLVDVLSLHKARQLKIDGRLLKANAKRFFKDYAVGDRVMVTTAQNSKAEPVYTGPHEVLQVHTNGTITIRRGAHFRDRVNIRQVKPAKV